MKKKLRELAEWVGGRVVGDEEVEISGVGSIDEARSGEITFIANPKYLPKLGETNASAVIVSGEVTQAEKPLLCVTNPYLAFAKIVGLFSYKPYQPKGIDPKSLGQSDGPVGQRPYHLLLRLYWRPLSNRRSSHPLSWRLCG